MGPPPTRRTRTARRRRRSCLGTLTTFFVASCLFGLGIAVLTGTRINLPPSTENTLAQIRQPDAAAWKRPQPTHGVDISFPQCGRTFQDLANGFVIVGLDGGMPDRPNRCFAEQWAFARRQAGAAIYVNTADPGTGDPATWGEAMARGDLRAIADHEIPANTPIWLDVELTEVWVGSQARHRQVISAHLARLARSGHPVGVYSAPGLWEEITGDAAVTVPVWVGLGRTSAERAAAQCGRIAFGQTKPALVQRIGTASDGKTLDRNTVCPAVSLAGLVRPN